MISLLRGKSHRSAVKILTLSAAAAVFFAVVPALGLLAAAPVCRAESAGSSSNAGLDKHARKIHHELSRFPTGSYIHLTMNDGSERTVALVSLEDESFTSSNAETNNRETHEYADIHRVTREKDYIGEGSEGHVRHIRLWVPITAAVIAAGAAFAAAGVR